MARPTRQIPPARRRINPLPVVLAGIVIIGIVAAFAMGAGGGTAGPQATFNVDCEHWCGSGTATISFGGSSSAVTGGGCYDTGAAGIDARFGDWLGVQGVSDYLQLTIRPVSLASPTLDSAGDTPIYEPIVTGSINGSPFVLGPDAVIRYTADGTGSFSGTDLNGGGSATGTFTCH
jgi:hypothetical protein